MTRRIRLTAICAAALLAGFAYWWSQVTPNYLPKDSSAFVAQMESPPAQGSSQARAEIAELLAIQSARTEASREAARADRKKDLRQFYGALGLDAAAESRLTPLRNLMERVESDVGIYVRAAKHQFARPRPYVVEPRLAPCIDDVADNQSYPSGHATYGYVVALILADMVPERRMQLLARADSFARSRMICGVHYASDLATGRSGAEWLVTEFWKNADYRAAAVQARDALRAVLFSPAAGR